MADTKQDGQAHEAPRDIGREVAEAAAVLSDPVEALADAAVAAVRADAAQAESPAAGLAQELGQIFDGVADDAVTATHDDAYATAFEGGHAAHDGDVAHAAEGLLHGGLEG